MNIALYNFGWQLLRPLIGLLLRHRARRGKEISHRIGERFGYPSPLPPLPGVIWLHAVSVGETMAAISLLRALAKTIPSAHFLITTNTVTAAAIVDAEISASPHIIAHAFQPLDHPAFIDRFLQSTKPAMAIFLESDFWPNLVSRTAQSGVPVVFASSQLSDTAFARWICYPDLARVIFAAPQAIFAVDKTQQKRFCKLGATADSITTLGSLKLGVTMHPDAHFCAELRRAISKRKLLLAASTHPGEDEVVIAAADVLDDGWTIIIAPRHPERGQQIADAALKAGLVAPRRSLGQMPDQTTKLFIADSLGEMGSLFSLATIVFLGGSLVPDGGHNPLEPAAFGLPIITGPHIFKNDAEFDGLRKAGIVFDLDDRITSGPDLAELAQSICTNTAMRKKINKAAKAYVAKAALRADTAAETIKTLLDR